MDNFLHDIIKADLASGKVKTIITRFPPEPNGYLHIGHTKSICLNYGLAIKYGGKYNLRFDDTNPLKEEDEYVHAMIEDIKWMGFAPSIFYASDYFDINYNCAVKLIEKGKAYVDDITAEELRRTRGTLTEGGEDSKNRNRPIAESLSLFEDMKSGKVADGALVLRARINMQSPNMNMRDPVIYRVLNATHYRQGDKWCIYPMYDFSHPLGDAVEGITHSICTLEFEDHRPLYDWVLDNCWEGESRPRQFEFARLGISRNIMSKRYLKMLVDKGQVSGWDDPRMPTLTGLRRRGFTPTAIKRFCADIGVAKADSQVDTAQLEFSIRDELNMLAPRAMAVLDPLELVLTNGQSEILSFEINPNSEKPKTRKISFSEKLYIERGDFELEPPPKYNRLTDGGMVRLKNAYIIKCTAFEKDKSGKVTKIIAEILPNTKSGNDKSGIKVKGVIHWVNANDCVDMEARLFDYLLNDGEGSFEERFNDNSLVVMRGKAEKYLAKAKKGESFQFLRNGYFVRDEKENDLVFNRIVGLKDGYKK